MQKRCWLASAAEYDAGSVARVASMEHLSEGISPCDASFASLQHVLAVCRQTECSDELRNAGLLCEGSGELRVRSGCSPAAHLRTSPPSRARPHCTISALPPHDSPAVPARLLVFWLGHPLSSNQSLEWRAAQAKAGIAVKLLTSANANHFSEPGSPLRSAFRKLFSSTRRCGPYDWHLGSSSRPPSLKPTRQEIRHARCCSRDLGAAPSPNFWRELRIRQWVLVYPFTTDKDRSQGQLSLDQQKSLLELVLRGKNRSGTQFNLREKQMRSKVTQHT